MSKRRGSEVNRELSGVLLSMADQTDSELSHGPKLNHVRDGIDRESSRLSCVECVVATNKSGHIIRKDEAVDGAVHTWMYGYDAEGRLASVGRDGKAVETYAYDALGRRLEDRCEAFGGQIRRFAYNDADQLMSAGDVSYDYDTLGRLCARKGPQGASTYEYDAVGGLCRVSLPGGCVVEFTNDGEGKPLEKYVDGVLVARFAWLDFLRLHTLNDLTKKTFMTLHYQDGKRLPNAATMSEGGYAYDCSLGFDQVGTLKVVADSNGDVIKKIEYDSFGNVLCDKRPQLDLPLGFAGGVMDRDTGLVRFGCRYYLPEVGRFIAPDPARWRGGDPDMYDYCIDNPVSKVDPLGLEPEDAVDAPLSEKRSTVISVGGKEYDLAGAEDDARRKGKKYFWMFFPKPEACEKCQELEGKIFYYKPERPHPNCKCEMIKIEVKERIKKRKVKRIYGAMEVRRDFSYHRFRAIGPVKISVRGLGPFLLAGIWFMTNHAGDVLIAAPPGTGDTRLVGPRDDQTRDWIVKVLQDGADNCRSDYVIEYIVEE